MALTNPVFTYYGGKWELSSWIISHFPSVSHYNTYCEPYSGAFSVGIRKPLVAHNYYNDIDGRMVNFFRVIRENKNELIEMLMYTPYIRQEYINCLPVSDNPIEDARRVFVLLNQGRKGTTETTEKQWKRSKSSNTSVCNSFYNKVSQLDTVASIMRKHYIECLPAIKIANDLDQESTLLYFDPPYMPNARTNSSAYVNEMTIEDHETMLHAIKKLKSFVVVSGYYSDLYNDELSGWYSFSKQTLTQGYKKRKKTRKTEFVWCNYNPFDFQETATRNSFAFFRGGDQ